MSELPAPFAWPTPRQVRVNGTVGAFLVLLGAAPLAALSAAPRELVDALLPLAVVWLVLIGGAGALAFAHRRRGVVMTPARGGPQAMVEVRPQGAEGEALLVPLQTTRFWARVVKTLYRGVGAAEASAASQAGDVFLLTAGAVVPPELIAWLRRLHAAEGESESRAADVDAIATKGARSPTSVPEGIETDGSRYRYRSGSPKLAGWLMLMALAVLTAGWWPAHGIGGWPAVVALLLPLELALLYCALVVAPLTVEIEAGGGLVAVRRRRFGATLWTRRGRTEEIGLDVSGLPEVALRLGGRPFGITGPSVGGPPASSLAWLAGALRSQG
ncbi:MAG TPA: hypothetical protein VLW85_10535 [Myxococcales bacterium]|nr:hypothetical protein [Myxococcales bacterium]